MSDADGTDPFLFSGIEEIRRHANWFLALGVCFVVLGVLALGMVGLATLASMLVFGWLLAFGGVAQVAHAFRARDWSGSLGHVALGIFYAVVGALVILHPLAGAEGATLAIATLFLVAGIFRAYYALSARLPLWGWRLASGIVDVALSALIISTFPFSTVWTIGALVGIDLIFSGWTDIMLAVDVKETMKAAPAA